jgi:flagellar protein FlaI
VVIFRLQTPKKIRGYKQIFNGQSVVCGFNKVFMSDALYKISAIMSALPQKLGKLSSIFSKSVQQAQPVDALLSRLPLTLYPVSAPEEEIIESVRDYELDLFSKIPPQIKSDFVNEKVDINIPNPHVFISTDRERGTNKYVIIEPPLDQNSILIYLKYIKELERRLLEEGKEINVANVVKEVSLKSKGIAEFTGNRLILSIPARVATYYLLRNVFGFNLLTPLVSDPNIEDISINGLSSPVFIYHREYEYIPTNINFAKLSLVNQPINGQDLLDQTLLRLVYLAGKTISVASPIADGMLPEGDRIAATFRREVSVKGSSVVIRKFAGRPITILDLIISGVMSPEVAAYLWYAIDLRMTFMVMGVTGAGKTTILNTILNLVKETNKVVTIEDIPELRLAQDNWVQLTARQAYGDTGKEISLMDLVKLSLRYRPDIIVVGEIRGAEAYVLFQAISTGHGGATTFHAYDIESAVKRLMNNPLNIPQEWIPMMNLGITIRRLPLVTRDGKIELKRRVVAIDEIVEWNDFRRSVTWDPKLDQHRLEVDSAKVMRARLEEMGKGLDEASEEIMRRSSYLSRLSRIPSVVQDPESYKLVKRYIVKYSMKPEEAMREVSILAK